MRALTLWQPWASLMAEKHKKIETRGWSTKIRGEVAIHAARKPVIETMKLMAPKTLRTINNLLFPFALERLPVGCVLATGNLVDCKLIDDAFLETLSEKELPLGDYTLGRYAWIFEDIQSFQSPFPAKGAQGFWDWKRPA
ncbi:ASCH domain protein [Desulfosporosinus acididurans]|uniref:ASCH domain protein n=1 Tax=Desulfosporosinus acididurans TaxID=476652 RepID=A0A0J1FTD1_9FIRM|nr:ASCH domain-containing protein [Desulfosporosinus acididurans]KLU66734.1 ASCH domain protein [Desulfosporosinus acididurans]